MSTPEIARGSIIALDDIVIEDRFRKELGDVRVMADSIKEFGLIQPAVVVHDINDRSKYRLVAGGRRMAAVRILGWQFLEIGKHVIVRDETHADRPSTLRLQSMELEENLKRKDMTWAEQVEAKKKLYDLMVEIHGTTGAGGMTRAEKLAGETTGFGVRKLAAMLGESPATVSNDLQLANMVQAMPHLKKEESKSSAARLGTVSLALKIAASDQQKRVAVPAAVGAPPVTPVVAGYTLYCGKWQENIANVADASVDLVYTDLPYGTDLDLMRVAGASDTSSGHSGAITYTDDRDTIVNELPQMMKEAYRVLKENRFAVFFFGFNYYAELVASAKLAGFGVNLVPVVWLKHSQSAIAPTMRYANGYEQALVLMKGSPKFLRPGQANIVDVPKIASNERFQVAQQPIPLVERFILDMTLGVGATVLDFCSGVGTTGVAAKKNNRFPIMFEKSADQCLFIEQRMSRPEVV